MKAHRLGPRFVAFLFDMILLSFLSRLLISFGLGEEVEYFNGMKIMSLSYVENFLLYVIYFVGFALVNSGKTPGKILMKLKITDQSYRSLTGNQLIFRELLKSLFMPISFVSFIIALIRPDRKSLHDLLMNTFVVNESTVIYDSETFQDDTNEKEHDILDSNYYDDPADKDVYNDYDK